MDKFILHPTLGLSVVFVAFELGVCVFVWNVTLLLKVTIPSVESSILKIMLEYMYTGKCLFPRDDLNKAIEVCINWKFDNQYCHGYWY